MLTNLTSFKPFPTFLTLVLSTSLAAQQPVKKDSTGNPAPARYRVTTKPTVPDPAPTSKPTSMANPADDRSRQSSTNSNKLSKDPFRKGTIAIIHRNYASYSKITMKEVDNTSYDRLTVGVNAVYFVMDHIGVGLDLSYLSDHSKSPGTQQNLQSWGAFASITYGRMISERVGAFIRFSGGPSQSRSYLKNSITPSIVNSKFTDLKGSIGFPILLEKQRELYLTPYITYDKDEGDFGNHHVRDVNMNLGFRLESYIATGRQDRSQIDYSTGKYKAGTSFLEYSTSSGFYSTTRHETQGDIQFADVKRTGKTIGLGYGYYFIDNVAGLLELGISSSKVGKGSNAARTSSINIHPSLIGQVPLDGPLNNLFLQAGYNYTSSNLGRNTRQTQAYLGLRAGYNIFLTKNLAFTPKLGYETGHVTTKSTGRNDKATWSGPAAELGIRAWLNWKWK